MRSEVANCLVYFYFRTVPIVRANNFVIRGVSVYCYVFESSNPQARKTVNMSDDRGGLTFCFKQKNN